MTETQLAMMEEEVSRKRAVSEAREEESGQKRSRYLKSSSVTRSNATPSFIPISKGNHFLLLHLQILRSLYSPTILDDEDVSADANKAIDKEEDGEVSDDFFATIHKFLKERSKLRGLVESVKMSKGVQEEAAIFVKEEKESASALTPNSPGRTREALPNMFSRSSSAMIPSQQSPYPQRYFSASLRNDQSEMNSGSLNLMAVLLRRKYLIADKMLKQQTDPFKAVFFDVRQRVQKIESLLSKQSEDTVDASTENAQVSPGTLPDESEEDIARLETKLRLWKLLLLDLESTA
jgi:hypothetical protein